jgi:hypothetical protein
MICVQRASFLPMHGQVLGAMKASTDQALKDVMIVDPWSPGLSHYPVPYATLHRSTYAGSSVRGVNDDSSFIVQTAGAARPRAFTFACMMCVATDPVVERHAVPADRILRALETCQPRVSCNRTAPSWLTVAVD